MVILITHGVSELVPVMHPPFSSSNTGGNLLPAFVDGLLSVNGLTIVDGFESSYTRRTPREFLEARWQMDQAASFSRDPRRYRARMQKAFALWIDPGQRWDDADEDANYFSPSNLENALHWALRCSDRYVWLYTESVNWFRDVPMPNDHVPSAAYDRALAASRAPHDPRWLPEGK